MEVKKLDNTNFGWCLKTHKRQLAFALKESPSLKKYKKIFKAYVQMPDYDELGQMGNWHFYSLDTRRSYLDYNGKNNAFYRYKLHISNMMEQAKLGNTEDAVKHAARSIHMGQDMSQPHHTQKGWFFNKVWNVVTHVKFEEMVKKAHKVYLAEYIKSNLNNTLNIDKKINEQDFIELFLNSVNSAKHNIIPTSKNASDKWDEIGKMGFNQSLDFTRRFISKFDKLVNSKFD